MGNQPNLRDRIDNTWENIKRSTNGEFAHSDELDDVVKALERLEMKVARDTANLTKQVSSVRNEVYAVNSRLDRAVHGAVDKIGRVNEKVGVVVSETSRVKRHVDLVDSDVQVLKLRLEAVEQLQARPQEVTNFHGGEHIHIYGGAFADRHTREFVRKLKSTRHSRSEKFKSQEDADSDSDSDDGGYLSHA